jgi:hypothetical protein
MPFRNNNITTTSCSGTSVTGSTIYSGSSEWSTIRISQNRKLLYSSRTTTSLFSGTGVITETVMTSITIPPNTLQSGDTLEIYALFTQTASGITSSTGRIRVGISADTNNTNSPIFSSAAVVATNAGFLGYTKVTFTNNSTSIGLNNGTTYTSGTLAQGSLYNLSGTNTYITFTGQRGNLSSTLSVRDYDVFLNR